MLLCCCGGVETPPPCCDYFGLLPKPRGDAIPDERTIHSPITIQLADLPPPPSGSIRIVAVSDTHERHRSMLIPPGDVFIHGGDVLEGFSILRNPMNALRDFFDWFCDDELHPHPVKICIAGNHDKCVEQLGREEVKAMAWPSIYLEEESLLVQPCGLRIYGSPRSWPNSRWSPNTAFQSVAQFRAMPHVSCEEGASTTPPSPRALSAHTEEGGPHGPIDVLLTHQSPEDSLRQPFDEQPICHFVESVGPRRLHIAGHLHGARGLHRLPYPQRCADELAQQDIPAPPFLPSINAAMLQRRGFHVEVLHPSVIDIEV